jgi:hypothetical protein
MTLTTNTENEIGFKRKDFYLLGETMVMMGADLFEKLYDMSDELDYTSTAVEIRDAAIEFEEQLDWKSDGSEERDYIEELEKFEQKKLEEWRKIYS